MVHHESSLTPLTDTKILVAGGSGFIGSHLVGRLLREKANLAVVARSRGKLDALRADDQFSFFPCDLQNAEEIQNIVGRFGPNIIIHLAANADSRESFDQANISIRSNALCTLNILEAFRRCHGELLIYGDTCKVYGDAEVPYRETTLLKPTSSYAIGKATGWQLCNLYRQVHGINSVSIRPTIIHGPRQAYNLVSYVVDCVMNGRGSVVLDGGNQTRDLLWVEDAVEAFVLAARRGRTLSGRVINIGGGTEMSVSDIARVILDILDSEIPVVSAPERMRATEMQRSYCDNLEAGMMLGWKPALDLRMGLEKTIAALLEQQVTRAGEQAAMARAASAA